MSNLTKKTRSIILTIILLGFGVFPAFAEETEAPAPSPETCVATVKALAQECTNEDLLTILSVLVDDFPYQEKLRDYIPGTYDTPPEDAPFTGLIIVACDLGFERALSPKIIDCKGRTIYGLINIDAETAREPGIAGYAQSVEEARVSKRVGPRPLVINALEVKGEYPCYLVVSNDDAVVILLANAYYHFLEKLKVVIVD